MANKTKGKAPAQKTLARKMTMPKNQAAKVKLPSGKVKTDPAVDSKTGAKPKQNVRVASIKSFNNKKYEATKKKVFGM